VELPTSGRLEAGERGVFLGWLPVAASLDGEAERFEDGEEGAGGMRVCLSIDLTSKMASKFECCDV
jgi:hypothetical protein